MFRRIAALIATMAAAVVAAHADAGGAVRARIEALVKSSGADVAVAFRTLDGRDELLMQPDVEFHAASTMKVPVMIELFAHAIELQAIGNAAREADGVKAGLRLAACVIATARCRPCIARERPDHRHDHGQKLKGRGTARVASAFY